MQRRLLIKTTSYGLMHIIVAFIVAYAITRNLPMALGISLIEPAVQTVCFYFHERIWNKLDKKHNVNLTEEGLGIAPPCCQMTLNTIKSFQKGHGKDESTTS